MAEFSYLNDFLGGYFHQDAYDEGQTDDDIVADFKASSWPYQRLGVRADIGRFLHQHGDHPLAALETLFRPALTLAETDEQARAWLEKVQAALEE